MKPTLFVQIDSQGYSQGGNPLAKAIEVVSATFGAEIVEELVREDVEAHIAVTNTVSHALRMVKETETTHVVLASFYKRDQETAEALASRYPGRISAVAFIGEGEEQLVPCLIKLIAEKAKEA